jgi:hypothetical protein
MSHQVLRVRMLVLYVLLFCVPQICTAVSVENRYLRIGLDTTSGTLSELTDMASGRNLIVPAGAGSRSIWTAQLLSGTQRIDICTSNAAVFRCSRQGRELRATWSEFDLPDAPSLTVEVVVSLLPDSQDSRWNIAVSGLGKLELAEVRFPRLLNLAPISREHLAAPVWMGEDATLPRQLVIRSGKPPARLEWEYPGRLALQCLALYSESVTEPGIYFASTDPSAFRKSFAVFGLASNEFCIEQTHLPKRGGNTGRWTMPYESIVGTLHGDWFTAAERYRDWASQQVWARESRLRRGLVPAWLRDCNLWVWNRGRSDEVLSAAIAMKKLAGMPVGVFWHWWHGCAYDTGFPEYLPPREGTESFKAALAAAHREQVPAILYMNQRLWGMTTRSWVDEGAERYAVKGPDGKVKPEIYNTFTNQACASMCMGTQFWRNKYAGLAERAILELGADGIYMDQACSSLACYDPTHGHPVGGGEYWVKGFQMLAADIRSRCRARRPITLAGEGCAEPWLPYLDLMLSLEVSRERYSGPNSWETIPFFHAVYHADALMYGNYSSLTAPPYDELWPADKGPTEPLKLLDRKYSRQFALEQARSFVWGQQLTIANFRAWEQLESRPDEISQVIRLARLRNEAIKYLRDGDFLRPPVIAVSETTIPMSRLSIYAGRTGGVTSFEKKVPQVLAAAWSAPDGDVGIAIASTTDEALEFPLQLDGKPYGLRDGARIRRIDDAGRRDLGRWTTSSPLQIQLPPRNACIVEFRNE